MSLNFEKCDVLINGTGFLASQASIESSNSLAANYILGRRGIIGQEPSGPLSNLFRINYLLNSLREPNIELINAYNSQNNLNPTPAVISIGGISGEGYLQNFTINVGENQPVSISATYVGFLSLSGEVTEKDANEFTGFDISHSWSTHIQTKNGYKNDPALSFDYNFNSSVKPTYTIGRIQPSQVDILDTREDFTLIKDFYTGTQHSGTDVSDDLLTQNGEEIEFIGLATLCNSGLLDNIDSVGGNFPTLNVSGAKINSVSLNASLDDIVRVTFKASKFS